MTDLETEQADNHCGPHSLSIILAHAGYDISPGIIANEIYEPEKQATNTLAMLVYAREQGANAKLEKLNFEALTQNIEANIPVLVALKNTPDDHTSHFVVVYGISNDRVVMHDGYIHDRTVPSNVFRAQWGNAGNTALWIEQNK